MARERGKETVGTTEKRFAATDGMGSADPAL